MKTNVAKDINKGLRATKEVSRNLTEVILGHKDPLEWRLESTKVGLAKLVEELKAEMVVIVAATAEKDHIQFSAAREALATLVNRALAISSWLSRIDELEDINSYLATARQK